jgi:glycosyltransferase involved in cell wall biosynthesis
MTFLYSVVIPVYNEAEILPILYRRLTQVMDGLGEPYEIILVNDGSMDASPKLLWELRRRDTRVKVVSLSRNFGHQIAITAGLDYSSGEAVVVMDADLQDPPEVIPRLIAQWRAGYDIVFAVRENRKGESVFKRGTAALFYRLLRHLTTIHIPVDAGDFRLMSRRAVEALKPIRERNRFVRGLVSWIGFRHTSVTFVRDVRHAGETKYPLRKMARFALNGIISFSFLPLQLASYLGVAVSFISFAYIVYAVGVTLFTDRAVQGWASVIIAVLFIGGVQLISLGIIGEYIGRIHEEVKQRPLYLIDELAGFERTFDGESREANSMSTRHDRHGENSVELAHTTRILVG